MTNNGSIEFYRSIEAGLSARASFRQEPVFSLRWSITGARDIGRLERCVKKNMIGISGVVYAFQEHPLRSGSIRDNLLLVDPDAHRPGDIGYEFEAFIEKAKPWGLTHLCSYEKHEQWFARIVGLGRNRCRVSGVCVVP